MVSHAKGASIVTRSEEELAAIGEEFLRGKSRLMDESTRMKTLKLAGARYIIFIEVTDWVDTVESRKLPFAKSPKDVLLVSITLYGSVVDLQTGKILSSGNVDAKHEDFVADGHGDPRTQVKVAEEAADNFLAMLDADGVLTWE
jgi:hypothetical protein